MDSPDVDKSSVTFLKRTPTTLEATVKDTLVIQQEGGVGKDLSLAEHFGKRNKDIFSYIV